MKRSRGNFWDFVPFSVLMVGIFVLYKILINIVGN